MLIYWMFSWVLKSLCPLQVLVYPWQGLRSLVIFPCYFIGPLVKGNYNFWNFRGIIDGFNKSRRKIASETEKW